MAGVKYTTESIIKLFKNKHGELYDYSRVIFKTVDDPIIVGCRKHRVFTTTPYRHLNRALGCPKCSYESRGHTRIDRLLKSRLIESQPADFKAIPLGKGKVTLVDNEDYEFLSKYNWHLSLDGYACNRVLGRMHRYILQAPKGVLVDHIDRDKLNNRRFNLRIATVSENSQNSGPRNGSKYKGVSKKSGVKPWRARIYCGREVNLGSFETEIEAAKAYNKKALELFGKDCFLNEIFE